MIKTKESVIILIYLDDAASTKPKKEVIDTVINLLQNDYWYNPNSIYESALECRRLIEKARIIIAQKINCLPEEIIFVPSSSCANTLAILGYMNANEHCHNFITTTLEHSSIYEIELKENFKWKNIVKCDSNGLLYPEQFKNYHDCLISICGCSSEVGTIQPIHEIAQIVHKNNNIIHSDLTAYWPHINVDINKLGIDMASFGSHKINGLKNCGFLYVKKGIVLSPIVFGHNTLFGGTPDIYQICAMSKATELLNYDKEKEIKEKRNYLLDKLLVIDGIKLNGDREKRISNNINICIENMEIDNQQLVAILDMMGYCISAGTACASGNKIPSATLLSMGLTPEEANKSIRITLSNDNSYEELDSFYNDFKNILNQFYEG